MKKVIITTSSFGVFDQAPLNLLKKNGFEAILNPFKRKVTTEELKGLIQEHRPVGLIAGTENITSDLLKMNDNSLRCISRVGVGWDNIDHQAAEEKGIPICRTPDAVTPAVAELSLGLILNLLRKVCSHDSSLKDGVWKKQMGSLLFGKKVGVLGAGRIGKRVSELLVAFGAKVIAFDPYEDKAWSEKFNIQYEKNFESFISNMDIITIHASYNEEMKSLFNKNTFKKAKNNLLLVNLSRGEMINEDDLLNAIETGEISGAALDVYEKEPYEGPLVNAKNIILTPHVGSYAKETRILMESESVENLLSILNQG